MGNFLTKEEKLYEKIQNFCLFDDVFMTRVFDNDPECTQVVLRIILDKPDLTVEDVKVQHILQNLTGRSIKLDIHAKDSKNKYYNIEIQNEDKGTIPKRARYHSSIMDANVTEPGEDFDELPENYVIFITRNDVLNKGLPLYHIDRFIEDCQEPFGDESHIIYVNGSYKDDSPLGLLIQDFSCRDVNKMHTKVLKKNVEYYKLNKEGVKIMSTGIDDLIEEGIQQGIEQGIEQGQKRSAINLLYQGKLSISDIASVVELPVDEVQKIQKELQSNK